MPQKTKSAERIASLSRLSASELNQRLIRLVRKLDRALGPEVQEEKQKDSAEADLYKIESEIRNILMALSRMKMNLKTLMVCIFHLIKAQFLCI